MYYTKCKFINIIFIFEYNIKLNKGIIMYKINKTKLFVLLLTCNLIKNNYSMENELTKTQHEKLTFGEWMNLSKEETSLLLQKLEKNEPGYLNQITMTIYKQEDYSQCESCTKHPQLSCAAHQLFNHFSTKKMILYDKKICCGMIYTSGTNILTVINRMNLRNTGSTKKYTLEQDGRKRYIKIHDESGITYQNIPVSWDLNEEENQAIEANIRSLPNEFPYLKNIYLYLITKDDPVVFNNNGTIKNFHEGELKVELLRTLSGDYPFAYIGGNYMNQRLYFKECIAAQIWNKALEIMKKDSPKKTNDEITRGLLRTYFASNRSLLETYNATHNPLALEPHNMAYGLFGYIICCHKEELKKFMEKVNLSVKDQIFIE